MEAILEGIKMHVAQGHARVVIVFFALESSKPDLSYIRTGDYGFLQLRQVFKAVSFSWVRRSGNKVAHSLVLFAYNSNYALHFTSFSNAIVNVVLVDFLAP